MSFFPFSIEEDLPANEFKKKYCSAAISSNTFGQVKRRVLEYIKDPEVDASIKISFGNWLFRKVYLVSKLSDDVKKEILPGLTGALRESTIGPLRATYLQYCDVMETALVASHFFFDRYDHPDGDDFIIQMLNDVQLIKGYIQNSSFTDEALCIHFLEWIEKVPVYEQRSNLLDVLLKYYPKDQRVKDVYEEMKLEGAPSGPFQQTIYNNAQNAHDEPRTNEVLKIAGKLVKADRDRPLPGKDDPRSTLAPMNWARMMIDANIPNTFRVPGSPETNRHANAVIDRACMDNTNFEATVENVLVKFTIADVLVALLAYIKDAPENAEELWKRLSEEMTEMAGLCSTGYIARLVNVLQGFDENYQVKMSFDAQLEAVLSKKLADEMKSVDERAINGITDPDDRPYYVAFIKRVVDRSIYELFKTYGEVDVKESICRVVDKISGLRGWSFDGISVYF